MTQWNDFLFDLIQTLLSALAVIVLSAALLGWFALIVYGVVKGLERLI